MNTLTTIKNTLGHLAVTSFLVLSLPAVAGQTIDRSIDTSGSPRVDIEHLNGSADIRGWDKSEVKVTGELGENTEEFIFEKQGNVILIHVEVERKGSRWGSYQTEGDELVIYVPFNSSIDYNSINADVRIKGVKEGVSVDVVNGDVDIKDVGGSVEAEAVNGDIEFHSISGRLSVETVNGSIEGTHSGSEDTQLESVNGSIAVDTSSPRVFVETVNGRIKLGLADIDTLEVNTVNGRMTAEMHLQSDADVNVSSVGGGINLLFDEDVSARFDIEAHAGGSITNSITDDKMKKAKYGPRRWLQFVKGDGDANVDISTVHGRVSLETQ